MKFFNISVHKKSFGDGFIVDRLSSIASLLDSSLQQAHNHDGYSMSQHWALKEEILWNIFHKLKKKFFSSSLCIFDVVHLSGKKYFPSLLRWYELFFIHFRLRLIYEKYFMIRGEREKKSSSSSSLLSDMNECMNAVHGRKLNSNKKTVKKSEKTLN